MVTIARQFARPIALVILLILLAGAPATAWAEAQGTATSPDAVEPESSLVGARPAAATPRFSADIAFVALSGAADHPPLWRDASATAPAPAKSGSWWSRRSTAQKTWFIVGMVVGAVGIYALATNGSNDSGGSGGGGY
jgi:hypothetical protein